MLVMPTPVGASGGVTMGHEIEIFDDGDGVALIGEPSALQRFLSSAGLASRSLDLTRLGPSVHTASALAQAGSEIAAGSGRWVKLTEQSAAALNHAQLMKGSTSGVSRAIVTESGGRIKSIL